MSSLGDAGRFVQIPLVKLLPQKGFYWLVDTNIEWLQSVRTVCRNHDYMDVIVFKELQKTLVPWPVNLSNITSAGWSG